jgi:transcriptional antiterminator
MTDLFLDEVFTVKDLAEQFRCTTRTIHRHANKLFGVARNGVARTFNKPQVTMILDSIKNQKADNPTAATLTMDRQGSETALTLDLEIENAEQELVAALMKSKQLWKKRAGRDSNENQSLKIENKELKIENAQLKVDLKAQDKLNANLMVSNEMLARLAESEGNIVSDREDMENTYRRGKNE